MSCSLQTTFVTIADATRFVIPFHLPMHNTLLSWLTQEVDISEAEVTSAISHHDRSQMMTELLPIFQVGCISAQTFHCCSCSTCLHVCKVDVPTNRVPKKGSKGELGKPMR